MAEADLIKQFADKTNYKDAINVLLSTYKVHLLTAEDGSRFFKLSEDSEAKRKGLTRDENLVRQEIAKSANSGIHLASGGPALLLGPQHIPRDAGIWTKDLRKRTGLSQPVIARAIKVLEQRELIKAIKSVNYANRKYYMLFELEPSEQVTGGAW